MENLLLYVLKGVVVIATASTWWTVGVAVLIVVCVFLHSYFIEWKKS